MIINFDFLNQATNPFFILCNPDKTELKSIGTFAYSKILTLKYNALSEFSFSIPDHTDTGLLVDGYDLIESKRLILIENVGYFRIDKVEESLDGIKKIKSIHAFLLEAELIQKKLVAFGGTYKLYDYTSPSTTLLGKILELIPTWSIGTVDASILNTYRTFNISDSTIYSFLMNDVENAYGCIFTFDSFNKTISAIDRDNATYESDIYLSNQNLIKELNITEISDEITTALYVYGGGNLDIRSVNPIGTPIIYNFDYYKNTNWMSQSLIDAITAWQTLVDTNQPIYATDLTTLLNYNISKLTATTELAELNSEFLTLEGVQKARIEANLPYPDITAEMNAKQTEIDSKELEIESINSNIASISATLVSINELLQFSNNFTEDQLLELNNFIIENTYQNENFVKTSIMTPVEIQDVAQSLYDQGVEVLSRLSEPRYEFSVDGTNFLFLKEYETFINQLQLGSIVTIEKEEDSFIETVLLEIKINYDDPSDFSMTFSNRLRLDNSGFIYGDLFSQAVRGATSVNFNSLQWQDWTNNYQDTVSSFITSSLNATVNNLINADNQEIVINQNGLKGKQYLPDTQTYSPKQVWLTSSVLAFTDDAWNTAKAALGEISINGTTVYGLAAEAVFGRLLAGSQLTIANENNNFTLDSTGAYLNNAVLSLNDSGNKVSITLSPLSSISHGLNLDPGLAILSNISGTWKKTLYADSTGNLNFSGTLSGANGNFSGTITANSGTIGGLTINSQGIQKDSNNYIRSDGSLKWGALNITGSSATFSGTIQADKLLGEVQWDQIVNAPLPTSKFNGGTGYSAGGITTGSMLGNRISGGTIAPTAASFNNGAIQVYSSGQSSYVDASGSNYLILKGTSAYLQVGSTITLHGEFIIGANSLTLSNTSSVSTPSGNGVTTTVTVTTPTGNKILRFSKGICYATS